MNRSGKHCLLTAALATLLTLRGSISLGDSLVTTDGDIYLGSITKTETGYTVQAADGPIDVPADHVKKVLYDHPPAGATPNTPVQATGTTPAPKAKDPQMLKALLGQGEVAYSAGEFTDARDAFTDALSLDPKNVQAARGLGFSYLKLGKTAKAVKPLELVAQTQPMDRALTMGLSAAALASGNSLRALKVVEAYLQDHPEPLDERMINALGIALAHVDKLATNGSLYSNGVTLYLKLNDRLNATQQGKKRWGIDWLPTAEFNKNQEARAAAQRKVDSAQTRLQNANARVQKAENALHNAMNSVAVHEIRDVQIQDAQTQLNNAQNEQQTVQTAYDDAARALAELPVPNFPAAIPLDGIQLSLDPNQPNQTLAPAVAVTAPPALVDVPKPPAHHDPSPQPADTVVNNDPTPATPAVAPAITSKHTTRYAVGFAIAPDVLVTAASAVEDATSIQITDSEGKTYKAVVLRAHHSEGLALLKVDDVSLPCLTLATAVQPGASASLTCLGFPEVDLFNPLPKSMMVSTGDQTGNWTVHFESSPRLPGGPLIEANEVVGVELGDRDSDLAQVPAATLKSLLSLARDSAQVAQPAKDPAKAVVQVMAER